MSVAAGIAQPRSACASLQFTAAKIAAGVTKPPNAAITGNAACFALDSGPSIASPYAIWVLKQASDKLPVELDEAATMDGATTMQLFRLVYVPLMMPSLVAVGAYAVLLAWNEYLYAFLLLSKDTEITLPVALGNFLAADDSPWELLMTTGFIYALPPAAMYYAFKRYMVGGLTAGAVKS